MYFFYMNVCSFTSIKNYLIHMKQLVNKGSNRGNFETVKFFCFFKHMGKKINSVLYKKLKMELS